MHALNENQRRELIGQFYNEHSSQPKSFTVHHFEEMGVPRRTTYNAIQRVCSGGSLKRKAGSGRTAKKMSKKKVRTLLAMFTNKTGCSQRKAAAKFNISQRYVGKLLRKSNVKKFKRQKAPKSTLKQKRAQKTRLNILRKTILRPSDSREVVMDDESYFPLDAPNLPGNDYFYCEKKEKVAEDVRFKLREKFPRRVMVWVAISPKGISPLYFAPRNCALDAATYSKECISKRLVPFIKRIYPDGNYIFWPDGASCHYAKKTLAEFERAGIQYVKREENPPCVPQLRPIEHFWALLKGKVYANQWSTENFDCLKRRIQNKAKEFRPEDFESLFANLKTKVRRAADNGPLAVIF